MDKKMKCFQTTILMLTLLSLFGCEGFGRTAKLGEPFTLKINESATVGGTGVQIILNRIGRKWGTKPNEGETLDFSFSVKYNGQTQIYSENSPAPIIAGKYKIETVKADPFGDGEATFVVTKIDSVKKTAADEAAAKFVESFGWHIDESIAPAKVALEFPKNFDGLPFYHYQAASQKSGVDMTPLLGRTVEMLKYTLKEKRTDREQIYTVYAHLIIDNGKVGGAYQTDSSASAPGIFAFVKR